VKYAWIEEHRDLFRVTRMTVMACLTKVLE